MPETTGNQYYRVGVLVAENIEWDPAKAFLNFEKHGIAFDIAVQLFRDRKRVEWTPPQQHAEEIRWKTAGRIDDGTLVTIIYTKRVGSIRIISARKASRRERREYRSSVPL